MLHSLHTPVVQVQVSTKMDNGPLILSTVSATEDWLDPPVQPIPTQNS